MSRTFRRTHAPHLRADALVDADIRHRHSPEGRRTLALFHADHTGHRGVLPHLRDIFNRRDRQRARRDLEHGWRRGDPDVLPPAPHRHLAHRIWAWW
jgi:hypothetical protein